ncbi:hypothetical protein [Clostridium estertheticum]|uniref:Uncharacterized protein n=1 Tax=Clostridium estertheticum TaxID=238834 RepID=A0A7Y3SZP3_9CLOT|nr:hypothetical protein [Clostridium estertheticum]NNU78350.1 hypothetical protein [Clostridium estertheticum]WBL45296.1 hypothetical protein LOR37_11330 [Clostridium estertheticum]
MLESFMGSLANEFKIDPNKMESLIPTKEIEKQGQDDFEEKSEVNNPNKIMDINQYNPEQIIPTDISELKDDDIGLQANIKDAGSLSSIEKIRAENPNVEKVLSDSENILKNTTSDLEIQKVDKNLEKYKGTIFENQLKESLKDNFEELDAKQKLVETEFGGTKPDIVLRDAKKDMKISDLEIKKGDDLFIEAKCGSSEYIRSEMGHILKQVEGHEDNSLVIVTKDYERISPQYRADFENELKQKGSHLYVADTFSNEVSLGIRDSLKI